MGTDLHMFVERKGADGIWHAQPPPKEFWWCEQDAETIRDKYGETDCAWEWDLWRNYDLFGILADVRNGVGFAGVDTGEGFIPISQPRGIPEDIGPELRGCLHVDHDPSWLTLAEISEYPHWRKGATVKRGYVDAYSYKEWVTRTKRKGAPLAACGGVSGPDVRIVAQSELDAKLDQIPTVKPSDGTLLPFQKIDPFWDGIYTQIEWPVTYREAAGSQWWRFFEVIQGYGDDPTSVRVVFYFDS